MARGLFWRPFGKAEKQIGSGRNAKAKWLAAKFSRPSESALRCARSQDSTLREPLDRSAPAPLLAPDTVRQIGASLDPRRNAQRESLVGKRALAQGVGVV